MRTITQTVYTFEELSEDVQKKVMTKMYDINVDDRWWDSTYEDAANVYLTITGFDTGRANDITGNFKHYAVVTANKIIKEHGEDCETYKTAQKYLIEKKRIEDSLGIYDGKDFDELELDSLLYDAGDDFRKELLEDYLVTLRKEYEYLTSEEAVKETIISNEYEFLENGNRFK